MPDTPDIIDSKQLVVWLGVITSALTIVGWFGVTDWHQFKAWLKHDGGQVSQVMPSALSASPAPIPTPVFSSRPVPAVDPGCTETFQVLRSFDASQEGGPTTITRDRAHALAIEYRGFASSID